MNKNYTSKCNYLDHVEKKFEECFKDKNYNYEESVMITSKIDESVDFVGSKISPLKKYIVNDDIPLNGVATIQNCMKMRSLKTLKDYSYKMFGSCYRGMGTLTEFNLEKVISDTFDYFLNSKYLGVNPYDLCIRINSNDKDLKESISVVNKDVIREYDTEKDEDYKHKYGMDDYNITGRNLNIAMRKGNTDVFHDCAAIIIMETKSKKIAIDMGIGNSTLAMCHFNTESTVAASRFGDIIDIKDVATMKFADSMIAVSTLLNEDILNHSSKHFRKKFRQYVSSLRFWKNELNIDDYDILNYMNEYLKLEYKDNKSISEEVYRKVLYKK